ncbi:MAG: chemotaxis protein CheW [Wenzhouxiangellaceae bacterium]|nr:chemotaxis protein CheW [Wenzhouxiangellaceae bacterium]
MNEAVEQVREALARGEDETKEEWIQFLLQDQPYALNVKEVQEILVATDLTPVPGAPYYVLGVINVRGSIVTVIDGRRRLGIAEAEDTEAQRWTIVLDVAGEDVGILVDDVIEVLEFSRAEISEVAADRSGHVGGLVETEHGMTILLNAWKLTHDDDLPAAVN